MTVRAGHQRGLGAVFAVSGLIYCALMSVLILYVRGYFRGTLRIGSRESYDLFMGHFWFFIGACALYLGLAWRKGERITLQDAADAAAGFLLYVILFTEAAFALAYDQPGAMYSIVFTAALVACAYRRAKAANSLLAAAFAALCASALAPRRVSPLWGLAPGLFHLAYGVQLLRRRALVDAERLMGDDDDPSASGRG